MPRPEITGRPVDPGIGTLRKTHRILDYATSTAKHLLGSFDQALADRGSAGAPAQKHQDLLRAMVVFAGAGLDSAAKRLLTDALPQLSKKHDPARQAVLEEIGKRLDPATTARRGVTIVRGKELAEVLLSASPSESLLEVLIDDVTSQSAQSVGQLCRAAALLGCDVQDVGITELRECFVVRNQIVHEMDIDLTQTRRVRRRRARDDMVNHCNHLLEAGKRLLGSVARALSC